MSLLLLSGTGCNDLLKEKPVTDLTPDFLFTTADNAQLAVTGVYGSIWYSASTWNQNIPAFGVLASGEVKVNGNEQTIDLKFTSTNSFISGIWVGLYQAINAANTAIEGISGMEVNSDFPEARKQQLIAEVKFLRAQTYYWLVRWWGGVPLQLAPTRNPAQDMLPRATPQEVFNQIIADLTEAAPHLPISHTGTFPDNGKVTRGAAKATLAKVYADMSGKQFEGMMTGGPWWNESKALLLEIIDEANPQKAKAPYMYSLEPDFKDLFTGGVNLGGNNWGPVRQANQLGREIIYCGNYDNNVGAGHWYFSAWNSNGVSDYVVSKFDPRDYRFDISIDTVGAGAQNLVLNSKFRKNRPGGNTSDSNFYETRYAELLLLLAEVENEINNGPTQMALDAINTLRARARGGLNGAESRTFPANVETGLSYAQFKEVVFDERAVELLLEFKFAFDIQRSGRFERDWAQLGSGARGSRGAYDPKWKFWPIPYNEVLTSSGLIGQNPGHE